ncbi:hypothetical protein [Luteolibacter sp. Populi]|uniref:hypothetical protein n=1 Tax=Luteolibacter sp. Populi TaxID=3230487 RepID=UPI0034671D31
MYWGCPVMRVILTHLAVLALGWWLAVALAGAGPAAKQAGAAEGEARAGREAADGSRLLREVLAKGPSAEKFEAFRKDFKDLAASMSEPADFAAALDAAVLKWDQGDEDARKNSKEIAALFYRWMEKDPVAAYAWAGEDSKDPRFIAFQYHGLIAFTELMNDKGWRSGLPLMLGKSGPFLPNATRPFGMALGADPDLAVIAQIKEGAEPMVWGYIIRQLAADWPIERRGELLELALAENSPAVLARLGKGKPTPEMVRWMAELAKDESVPEKFRKEITDGWLQMATKQRELPLEERLEWVKGDDKLGQLVARDVDAVLNEGRDWRHAFRNGKAGAEEILAAISKELPELAAGSPDVLRERLYYQLAEEDGARAAELLNGMTDDQRAAIILGATRSSFSNINPNEFLAALAVMPADKPELWDARLGAWSMKTPNNYGRLKEDYVEWVRDLPAGLDREMGLFSLAESVEDEHPALAAELRAGITDGQLRKRLEGGR